MKTSNNVFSKRIMGLFVGITMFVVFPQSVLAATTYHSNVSYVGNSSGLKISGETPVKYTDDLITEIGCGDQWYRSPIKYKEATSSLGNGKVTKVAGDNAYEVTMLNKGDANDAEYIDIISDDVSLNDFDLVVLKKDVYNQGHTPASGSLTMLIGNQIYPYEYSGKRLSRHEGMEMYNLPQNCGRVIAGRTVSKSCGETGVTYKYKISQTYMEIGGVFIHIDPNGGTYNQHCNGDSWDTDMKQLADECIFFKRQLSVSGASSNEQFLDFSINDVGNANKPYVISKTNSQGQTFAGWEFDDSRYSFVCYNTMGVKNPEYSLSADGSHLKVHTYEPGGYYRLDIYLKATWDSPSKNQVTCNKITDSSGRNVLFDASGNEATISGIYGDRFSLPNLGEMDSHNLTFDVYGSNTSDSVSYYISTSSSAQTSQSTYSMTTKKKFVDWVYTIPSSQDIDKIKRDLNNVNTSACYGAIVPHNELNYTYKQRFYNKKGKSYSSYDFVILKPAGAKLPAVTPFEPEFQEKAITLPYCVSTRNRYAFVGWYDTKVPVFTSYTQIQSYNSHLVGEGGKSTIINSNRTLYAGWSKLSATLSGGWWTSGYSYVQTLAWNTLSNNPEILYRIYRSSDKNKWSIVVPYGTDGSAANHSVIRNGATSAVENLLVSPAIGDYTISLQGGRGGSGSGGNGGNGGSVVGVIYMQPNHTFTGRVGGHGSNSNNGTASGGSGYSSGGSARGKSAVCYMQGQDGQDSGPGGKHTWTYVSWNGPSASNGSANCKDGGACGGGHYIRDEGTIDWWRCTNCGAWTHWQDFPESMEFGWRNDCWSAIASHWGDPYKHQSYQLNAGSGGGSTGIAIDGTTVAVAGGGNGASSSGGGSSVSSAWTSLSDWNNNATGNAGGSDGAAGQGAGRGRNFVNISYPNSSWTSYSSSSAEPFLKIEYKDYVIRDNKINVESFDKAAPYKPAGFQIEASLTSEKQMDITFDKTADRGTTTWYKIDMCTNNNSVLQSSEPVSAYVESGVKIYYFKTDTSSSTNITKANLSSMRTITPSSSGRERAVNIPFGHTYLHVAAIDKAGNLGETAHYPIPQTTTVTCQDEVVDINGNRITGIIDKNGNLLSTAYILNLVYPEYAPAPKYSVRLGSKIRGSEFGSNTANGAIYPHYMYRFDNGLKTVIPNLIVKRYFTLNLWTVTYDKNTTGWTPSTTTDGLERSKYLQGTVQHGNLTEKVQYTKYVDTRYTARDSTAHWVECEGWDFLGWSGTKVEPIWGTANVYNDNKSHLKMPDHNITLYAKWDAKEYPVTYHPNYNADYVQVSKPDVVQVKYTTPIDVNPKHHTAKRDPQDTSPYTAWEFMGWNTDRNATSVLNSLIMTEPRPWTVYAIFSRDFTLYTAKDTVGGKPEAAHYKRIYTHTHNFMYKDPDTWNGIKFQTDTERNAVTYKVKFIKTDDPTFYIVNSGKYIEADPKYIGAYNKVVGTDYNSSTSEIQATRYFDGWFSQDKSDHQCDFSGTRYGVSKTWINVDTIDADKTHYNISGDYNKSTPFKVYSTNRTAYIYPMYDKAYIRLPDAKQGPQPDPTNPSRPYPNGRHSDTFFGWFTKPQYDDNGRVNEDGGIFVGGPGDVVEIKSDMTLYPWFNIAPVIIHSILGQDLEGNALLSDGVIRKGFYEGQPVTYAQMMALINAYDVDNPREEPGPEGLITYGGVDAWCKIINMQKLAFLVKYFPDLTATERNEIINYQNTDVFIPKLVDIEYLRHGKDDKGRTISKANIAGEVVKINGNHNAVLDTSQKNIGDIILHYQVTDFGAWVNGIKVLMENQMNGINFPVDAEITTDFYLHTAINFNRLPRIKTTGVVMYTTDTTITSANIEEILMQKQDAYDTEDDREFLPWWEKAITSPALDNTLKIMKIKKIKIDEGYRQKHPEICATVQAITDVVQLFGYKDRGEEVFNYITSFEVELDCVDQWGKHGSGEYRKLYGLPQDYDPATPLGPDGMTPEDRTFEVILLNNHSNTELEEHGSSVDERVRYINQEWTNSLEDDSYWKENKSTLENILKTKRTQTVDANHTTNKKITNNGNKIDITVKDYTSK